LILTHVEKLQFHCYKLVAATAILFADDAKLYNLSDYRSDAVVTQSALVALAEWSKT
jgi:hypothetical protein